MGGATEVPTPAEAPSGAKLWNEFPKGLRVLAVDDDALTLRIIEKMLRRCNYTVTTAVCGKDAIKILRERASDFDLVLSDVYMPDMDGFQLLELIGLEMEVPVIMMSANGETRSVMEGITHGAVDYLLKPVRIEELRNIWQHVLRRNQELSKNVDGAGGEGERRGKKRKEGEAGDDPGSKKPRVVWTVELHQKFVNAVNKLGIDKAVPKRILDLMQVSGLTRENVASHLQKYRLYLKRLSNIQPQIAGVTGQQPGFVIQQHQPVAQQQQQHHPHGMQQGADPSQQPVPITDVSGSMLSPFMQGNPRMVSTPVGQQSGPVYNSSQPGDVGVQPVNMMGSYPYSQPNPSGQHPQQMGMASMQSPSNVMHMPGHQQQSQPQAQLSHNSRQQQLPAHAQQHSLQQGQQQQQSQQQWMDSSPGGVGHSSGPMQMANMGGIMTSQPQMFDAGMNYVPVDDIQMKGVGWEVPIDPPPLLGEDMGFDLVSVCALEMLGILAASNVVAWCTDLMGVVTSRAEAR
mmetsp:Transcript_10471/g.38567  ORF Transcript_10471/g.38567 Transcript_10471/m.38567 type:complete len:515 (+) Transcript_10471:361-1905(+)